MSAILLYVYVNVNMVRASPRLPPNYPRGVDVAAGLTATVVGP
jgi:hypothetical protein